jgi:hypothetical protein
MNYVEAEKKEREAKRRAERQRNVEEIKGRKKEEDVGTLVAFKACVAIRGKNCRHIKEIYVERIQGTVKQEEVERILSEKSPVKLRWTKCPRSGYRDPGYMHPIEVVYIQVSFRRSE